MALARFNCNSRRLGVDSRSVRGFSLVEVLVSMSLLTAMSIGVAQLFAMSARANLTARGLTSTTAMAEQKMEQLRSLTWGFANDGTGLPVSDTTSNLSVMPATPSGSGLNPSPSNALTENVTGFCDFLDAGGTWVGTGTTPPGSAVYVRRWAIVPLPTNPNNTLILQVLVTPLVNEAGRTQTMGPRIRMPGDSLLVSVKTRKAP
jgi:prepilin-type N-terminal cleavage/methylation domain-containing protein